MRTTLTLDPDIAQQLQAAARERGVSFKEIVNSTLRRGLNSAAEPQPYRVRARPMGLRPGYNLDKALQLAADFEDEELIHKMQLRK